MSRRLQDLPPYLFREIDRLKKEVAARGVDIINLGIGDPDRPTPTFIVDAMRKAIAVPGHHRYPDTEGQASFRADVSAWCARRFGVALDPVTEITTLIGSKEGIGHFPLAVVDPGDIVLIPSPGYPVYHAGTLFAGGESFFMPLLKEKGFLPDFEAIPQDIARRAKLMWLNYPNNPTGAIADAAFFEKAIAFAKANDVVIAHDAAYSETGYDGYRAISFLEVPGARDIGIEFHSLSKTFNMTGWRIGFAIGNAALIGALTKVKSNMDSGAFNAVQDAAAAGLCADPSEIAAVQNVYKERRDALVMGLTQLGLAVASPKATFYVWCEAPAGMTSAAFTGLLLDKAGIVSTPGNGFGAPGEGYVRFALTAPKERILEAVKRMEKLKDLFVP